MNLQDALRYLNHGIKVARTGWRGENMYIIKVLNATAEIRGETITYEPHLLLHTPEGAYVPWTISQTDATANDYVLIRESGIQASPKPPVVHHPAAIVEPLDQERELPNEEASPERMPTTNPDMPPPPEPHTVGEVMPNRDPDMPLPEKTAAPSSDQTDDVFPNPTPS